MTLSKPTFDQVKVFFRSWGLIPDDEEHRLTQINDFCRLRMKVDAVALFGKKFGDFVMKELVLEDEEYHIGPTKWSDIEKDFKQEFGE